MQGVSFRWCRGLHSYLESIVLSAMPGLAGISLAFTTDLFREWLGERDIRHLANALKRAAIDDQLVVRKKKKDPSLSLEKEPHAAHTVCVSRTAEI